MTGLDNLHALKFKTVVLRKELSLDLHLLGHDTTTENIIFFPHQYTQVPQLPHTAHKDKAEAIQLQWHEYLPSIRVPLLSNVANPPSSN